MRETRFIAQNKEKWQESENLLSDSYKDPEKLSNLFTQVMDDLSYSRTYYPNRSVRVYLNKIAREYFSIIYSHQKEKKNAFRFFWTDELPQIVYQARKPMLLSLIVFLFSVGIGVFSSVKDPSFASAILGERYVEMTKANIEDGDPMAVYKSGHQVEMFLDITFNNLRVAFATYVCGIFLSIGTLAILLSNGIMVGCFQYFFIERGLFAESALSIWLHGTLEISSIILAGGAGLTLGSGLIFPGTYSRLQAFQISGMRSLKLMLGIAPIFVLAAVIESFMTRYTDVPDSIRLFLILISAVFIIGYFVVYPWVKHRSGFEHPLKETKLPVTIHDPVDYTRIRNSAEIVKDAFLSYKKHFNKLLPRITLITLGTTMAEFLYPAERSPFNVFDTDLQQFFGTLYYALRTPDPVFMAINAIASASIVYAVFSFLDADAKKTAQKKFSWKTAVQTLLLVLAPYALLYSLEGWGALTLIVTFTAGLTWIFVQTTENSNVTRALRRTWELATDNWSHLFGLKFVLLLLSFSFLVILSAPLLYLNTTVLQWNFAESDSWSKSIVRFVEIFLKLYAFNLVLPLIAASAAHLYFTLREIVSAEHLQASIARIGIRTAKSNRR